MAQPTDSFKLIKAYFHAMNAVNTLDTQNTFESLYSAKHTIKAIDVWTETVDYCIDVASADAFAIANPTIVVKHVDIPLTMITGSNGQAWYVDIAGQFINPFISPRDIVDPITKAPSYGFQLMMKTAGGVNIPPATGTWEIDYANGILFFQLGSTPSDMGWGIPTVTFYQYVGKRLADGIASGVTVTDTDTFTNADLNSGILTINHNLHLKNEIGHVTIKTNTNVKIEPDNITYVNGDRFLVDLRMIEPIAGTWTWIITGVEDTNPVVPPIANRFLDGSAINRHSLG